jgi:hypothetical protein
MGASGDAVSKGIPKTGLGDRSTQGGELSERAARRSASLAFYRGAWWRTFWMIEFNA